MSPILTGVIASGVSGQLNTWSPQGAYDSLNSSILTTTASSVTFTGIPETYKHLQIRMVHRVTAGTPDVLMQFNGDTTSGNYRFHLLRSQGSGAGTGESYVGPTIANTQSTYFTTSIIDILDYSSTTKVKHSRNNINGWTDGSSGEVGIWSQGWYNTSFASTASILLSLTTGTTFAAGTSISLYGVK